MKVSIFLIFFTHCLPSKLIHKKTFPLLLYSGMARSKDDFVFLLHHVFIQPNVYCQVKFSQYFDPSLTLFGIRMYSNHSLDKRRTLIINGKNPFFILNVFHIAFLPFIHTCRYNYLCDAYRRFKIRHVLI